MSQADLGQQYRLALLQECMASGHAFAVIDAAQQRPLQMPVLTLLAPDCKFGGPILEVLVRQGVFTQAEVDQAVLDCTAEGRPMCITSALEWSLLRFVFVMDGADNQHIVQMIDGMTAGGPLLPAVIVAGNSITACGYDPETIRKPQPADLERARRLQRARRHGR